MQIMGTGSEQLCSPTSTKDASQRSQSRRRRVDKTPDTEFLDVATPRSSNLVSFHSLSFCKQHN